MQKWKETWSAEACDPYNTALLVEKLLPFRLSNRTIVPENIISISHSRHLRVTIVYFYK